MNNQQQSPSPMSSCSNQASGQEMHNMGYSTPHLNNYSHVHSNQSCPPGSVENLESPHSIQSCSSVDTNHPHGGPGSVESYHHNHQSHQLHSQQQVYDSCKYAPVHSPMLMNPPTPQPSQCGIHQKPATPHQSKFISQ
jgi:hypothetical protein